MKEDLIEAVTARVLQALEGSAEEDSPRALLLGRRPESDLGYHYVTEAPYEAVVVGSLEISQLLCFREEQVFRALLEGIPVYLYTPGLPKTMGKNKALETEIGSAVGKLRGWGVLTTDGNHKRHLITAQKARDLKARGLVPPAGSMLTPSAKDIFEDTEKGELVWK